MAVIILPALWIDNALSSTDAGLFVVNTLPAVDSTGADKGINIYFELYNTFNSSSVATATLDIWVQLNTGAEIVKVVDNGVAQGSWTLWTQAFGDSNRDLRVDLDPPVLFDSEAVISVRVVCSIIGGGASTDTTYSFTAEDYVEANLVSAQAIDAKTIRVTFDEEMDDESLENITNYLIEFVPEDERQAAVNVNVVEATIVSGTTISNSVVDLTTDIELTFWKTYKVTGGAEIKDVSDNGLANLSATFASWTPPNWPANREFRIWEDLFAGQDRRDDISGDIERMASIFQDVVDMLLWDGDRFPVIWDVDKAPEVFIDALLQDLGNPHQLDLTLLEKRKLVDQLLASYKEHGTISAIENLARFFLGIDVTVYPYSDSCSWVLDVSDLGIDTILGPSNGAGLYTFEVFSATELTDFQENALANIIEVVKVAHEHYLITDTGDTADSIPWELGLSKLDKDTYTH